MKPKSKYCTWVVGKDKVTTDCKQSWLVKNDFVLTLKYCFYCGKPIKVKGDKNG